MLVIVANTVVALYLICLGLSQFYISHFLKKIFLEAPYKKIIGVALIISGTLLLIFTSIEYIVQAESVIELFEKTKDISQILFGLYLSIWIIPLAAALAYIIAYMKPTWTIRRTFLTSIINIIVIIIAGSSLGVRLIAILIILLVALAILTGTLMASVEKRLEKILLFSKYVSKKLIKYDQLQFLLIIPEAIFITLFTFVHQAIPTAGEIIIFLISLSLLTLIIKECQKLLNEFERDHTIEIDKVILI